MPGLSDDKTIDSNVNKNIYCNCCGELVGKTEIPGTHMDYLHVEKLWSYFSSKDLTQHSLNICEQCYERWVANFTILVEDFPIEEEYLYSEEELKQLNTAYEAELVR